MRVLTLHDLHAMFGQAEAPTEPVEKVACEEGGPRRVHDAPAAPGPGLSDEDVAAGLAPSQGRV